MYCEWICMQNIEGLVPHFQRNDLMGRIAPERSIPMGDGNMMAKSS